jgi:hypothetical protein
MKPQAAFLRCLLCVVMPSLAYADIAPPQGYACEEKKIGEACSFSAKNHGTCAVQRCSRYGDAFDCVMCIEVTETDGATSTVVEPESAFSPPLFEAAPVATTSSASPEQHGPSPVATTGCGRCAAGLGRAGSEGAAALVVWLLACAGIARRVLPGRSRRR